MNMLHIIYRPLFAIFSRVFAGKQGRVLSTLCLLSLVVGLVAYTCMDSSLEPICDTEISTGYSPPTDLFGSPNLRPVELDTLSNTLLKTFPEIEMSQTWTNPHENSSAENMSPLELVIILVCSLVLAFLLVRGSTWILERILIIRIVYHDITTNIKTYENLTSKTPYRPSLVHTFKLILALSLLSKDGLKQLQDLALLKNTEADSIDELTEL